MLDSYQQSEVKRRGLKREGVRLGALAAVLCCAWIGVRAQSPPALPEGAVYGRPVYLLGNDKLQVAVVKQGGSMLRIQIQGDPQGLSPFGNPEMVPEVPENRKLRGTMVGHFVCVDGFGSPSADERKAGLNMHGEAYLEPWNLVASQKEGATKTAKFSVSLPLLQESFTRVLQMVDGESVIYVSSELESNVAFDRPVNWGEHPFLFPPFLEPEKTVVDMSGKRSRTRSYPGTSGGRGRVPFLQAHDFDWPMAPGTDGKPLDLRGQPKDATWNAHTTTLMDPSRRLAYVTVLNTDKRYLLGYVFRREEYPFVQNYMSYSPNGWSGRGVEFATQPFDLPRREIVDMNRMFDTPVYRWLPAKSKIATKFLLFYVRSPEGMKGVDDVRMENGKLIVEDHSSGKTITLAASLPL